MSDSIKRMTQKTKWISASDDLNNMTDYGTVYAWSNTPVNAPAAYGQMMCFGKDTTRFQICWTNAAVWYRLGNNSWKQVQVVT